MPGFTATEQVVVDMPIRYSALHQEPSPGAIARECRDAKSAVVKTIQKLGFTEFKDCQYTYRLQSGIAKSLAALPRNRRQPYNRGRGV